MDSVIACNAIQLFIAYGSHILSDDVRAADQVCQGCRVFVSNYADFNDHNMAV
jgi:hypothetical protein